MRLRFLSLGLSLGISAPLHERVCGRFCKVSKTVVGGFVHRGFESHPPPLEQASIRR